jgi:hypothetical protein
MKGIGKLNTKTIDGMAIATQKKINLCLTQNKQENRLRPPKRKEFSAMKK